MIYYFSGTGNSRWVAEQIAKQTNDEVQSIPTVLKNGAPASVAANERVGVVFPVYAWGVPSIVEKFAPSITRVRRRPSLGSAAAAAAALRPAPLPPDFFALSLSI